MAMTNVHGFETLGAYCPALVSGWNTHVSHTNISSFFFFYRLFLFSLRLPNMSFKSYSRYEEHDGNGNSYSHSSIVVHELTDGEANALLANQHVSTPSLSPSMLHAPQPDYEIESGSSEAEYDSDMFFTDEEDDDERIVDHWFPSLFRKSIIEYLEDDEDDVMLDHPFDILFSNEVAEIEEAQDNDDKNEPMIPGHEQKQRQHNITSSPRKRTKHRHHKRNHDEDDDQEATDDTPVPVVVHIVM